MAQQNTWYQKILPHGQNLYTRASWFWQLHFPCLLISVMVVHCIPFLIYYGHVVGKEDGCSWKDERVNNQRKDPGSQLVISWIGLSLPLSNCSITAYRNAFTWDQHIFSALPFRGCWFKGEGVWWWRPMGKLCLHWDDFKICFVFFWFFHFWGNEEGTQRAKA